MLTVPAVAPGEFCADYFAGWLCTRRADHGPGRHLAGYRCGIPGQRVIAAVWGDDVHAASRARGHATLALQQIAEGVAS